MQLLAYPFRLDAAGAVVTVTDDTDDALSEGLAVMITTWKGERPLVPDFGITDPTFDELDAAEINAALDVFGPAIRVTAIKATPRSDTAETVTLEWEQEQP